jgi:hypothetical protein
MPRTMEREIVDWDEMQPRPQALTGGVAALCSATERLTRNRNVVEMTTSAKTHIITDVSLATFASAHPDGSSRVDREFLRAG